MRRNLNEWHSLSKIAGYLVWYLPQVSVVAERGAYLHVPPTFQQNVYNFAFQFCFILSVALKSWVKQSVREPINFWNYYLLWLCFLNSHSFYNSRKHTLNSRFNEHIYHILALLKVQGWNNQNVVSLKIKKLILRPHWLHKPPRDCPLWSWARNF